MNQFKQWERVVKGYANHRRLEILNLLEHSPRLSVLDIAEHLRVNFKTISEHSRRLALAGLLEKKYEGKIVRHTITKLGKDILKFLRMLE
ncbi:MAG: hypothetical protein A2117_00950 [Candidatus Wildermuthbacteria bacterium GWA2_46_15]|uniref:HTH arsR-type domain-containing protein n=1 Tax=Candidatus Wildermuthbacteria bacterium GWA2_46_15 TaxID=1802443 RepID=A0A1G2QQ26_9BACT|nr:MAG: hypothetical protein A2117_00950 [Candidatus Wildermuthbacteria bacterium GWA2_46_15]